MSKLRVDASDITLEELSQVEEALGCSLGTAFDRSQAKAIAAVAWITKKREEPAYTFAEALQLRMDDLEIVTEANPGEALGGDSGWSPPASLEPGL